VKITRCGKIYLEVNEMKTKNLKALEEIFEKNLSVIKMGVRSTLLTEVI
jgi:hypothetical protein